MPDVAYSCRFSEIWAASVPPIANRSGKSFVTSCMRREPTPRQSGLAAQSIIMFVVTAPAGSKNAMGPMPRWAMIFPYPSL